MNSLYLISNASIDMHRDNTLTKFTNVFDVPLSLPVGRWCVTLDTIIVNPVFCNIPLATDKPHIKLMRLVKIDNEVKQSLLIDINLPSMEYTIKSLITELSKHVYLAGLQEIFQFKVILPANAVVFTAFKEQVADHTKLTGDDSVQEFAHFQKKYYKQNSFLRVEISQPEYLIAIHSSLGKTFGLMKNEVTTQEYLYMYETVTCKNPFKLKSILPKYLNIEVSNIDCCIENDYRQIISTHALDMVAPTMHYKHFEQTQYGVLTSNTVKDFKVRILDENYQQLRIGLGQPTILKMNFRQEDQNDGCFFLTIKSGNDKTNFSHVLQPAIHLEDDYVCALTSITYPSRFNNLASKDIKFYIQRENVEGMPSETILVIPFNPDRKKISSIHELISQINTDFYSEEIENFLNSQLLWLTLQDGSTTGAPTTLHVKGLRNATYVFPAEIGLLLGQTNNGNPWEFTLKNQSGNEFLVGEQIIPTTPNFNLLLPNNMFLYCNFTDLVYMGGHLTNLLHIVPVRSQQGGYVTEEVRHLNYLQVRHKSLNILKFQLVSAAGDPIEFEREDDTVSITLKFMRKNK